MRSQHEQQDKILPWFIYLFIIQPQYVQLIECERGEFLFRRILKCPIAAAGTGFHQSIVTLASDILSIPSSPLALVELFTLFLDEPILWVLAPTQTAKNVSQALIDGALAGNFD